MNKSHLNLTSSFSSFSRGRVSTDLKSIPLQDNPSRLTNKVTNPNSKAYPSALRKVVELYGASDKNFDVSHHHHHHHYYHHPVAHPTLGAYRQSQEALRLEIGVEGPAQLEAGRRAHARRRKDIAQTNGRDGHLWRVAQLIPNSPQTPLHRPLQKCATHARQRCAAQGTLATTPHGFLRETIGVNRQNERKGLHRVDFRQRLLQVQKH